MDMYRTYVDLQFTPPHIIPLMEGGGGAKTSPEAIERAIAFYDSIGKKTIRLNKEVTGHVANRLAGALVREIVYLIEQGGLSVEDADTAGCSGPRAGWGRLGENMLFHPGGGEGRTAPFLRS